MPPPLDVYLVKSISVTVLYTVHVKTIHSKYMELISTNLSLTSWNQRYDIFHIQWLMCRGYLQRYRGIHHYSWPGTTLFLPPGSPQSAVPQESSWTVLNWGIRGKVQQRKGELERIVNSNTITTEFFSIFFCSTLNGCSVVAAVCHISLKPKRCDLSEFMLR